MAQMTTRRTAAAPRALARSLDAGLFKALGEPTRLHLLTCLASCCRPCSVGEIAACCEVDLSVVSRHLAQLAKAGVIEGKREGKSVRYAVLYGPVSEALRRLSEAIADCDPARRGRSCRCGGLCCRGNGVQRGGCC